MEYALANLEKKKMANRKWFEDHYVDRKLQNRLRVLIWSHGLTELELCSQLGITYPVWEQVRKGIRRPNHLFVYRLMEILGDEVQGLFLGHYIDDGFVKLIPGDIYEANKVTKSMARYIEKIEEEGKEFRYLGRK